MSLKKISYLTLFPEIIDQGLSHSLVGKARTSQKIDLSFVQIRNFAKDKHHSVDDIVYGGGAGMLLKADVMFDAWSSVTTLEEKKTLSKDRAYTILLSPQGKLLTQERAKQFAQEYSHLIFVCGHYEGIDERFIETCVDEEMSIGDYVLTGGEFAALVASDVIIRLIPEVVGNADSVTSDSLENGLLKAPQYTRPREFLGKSIPEVLISGNHAKIEAWREEESQKRTQAKRPDLWAKCKNL
jgi:tRNA (guanine37-N1)-methyltransferase